MIFQRNLKTTKKKKKNEIDNQAHLENSFITFESMGKTSAINKTTSDFDNPSQKVRKIIKWLKKAVEYDANVTRYIPGTTDLSFQGMVQKILSIKQSAQPFYNRSRNFRL